MALSSLDLQVVTFNCGRSLVDIQAFSSSLFQPYAGRKGSLGSSSSHARANPPDLIVLDLQELAPIAYSFIGGTFLAPYFGSIVKAVQQAGAGVDREYELVIARNVGMTAIVALATPALKAQLKVLQVAGVGVGNYGLGNKGAVGVRFVIKESEESDTSRILTFVSAHLAPMEDAFVRRNQDWEQIVRGLGFHSESAPHQTSSSEESEPLLSNSNGERDDHGSRSPSGMFDMRGPVFFAGDLNYRTSDISPGPQEHLSFVQPPDFENANKNSIANASKVRLRDQLDRERHEGKTLHLLSEAPITFPPTYKFSEKAQKTWPRNGEEPSVYLWSTHRFPSWCDRILYSTTLDEEHAPKSPLTISSYTALPLQPTSDHRPVTVLAQLDLSSTWWRKQTSARSPFPLKATWREDRIAGRRKELLVGLAALLTTTTEGLGIVIAITAGSVGGWFLLKAAMAP